MTSMTWMTHRLTPSTHATTATATAVGKPPSVHRSRFNMKSLTSLLLLPLLPLLAGASTSSCRLSLSASSTSRL